MIQAIIFDCFGVLITDALKAIRDELYRRDPEKPLRYTGFHKRPRQLPRLRYNCKPGHFRPGPGCHRLSPETGHCCLY